MPFQLSITENGINGLPNTGTVRSESYWEISDFRVTLIHDVSDTAITTVEFAGWENLAAHNAGKTPFFVKRYELPPGAINYSQTIGDGFAALYQAALALPEGETGQSFFFGAIIV